MSKKTAEHAEKAKASGINKYTAARVDALNRISR
jgi:hypothetical protein